LAITYLVGIVVLRSCKGALVSCVIEAHKEIEHAQNLKLRKKENASKVPHPPYPSMR